MKFEDGFDGNLMMAEALIKNPVCSKCGEEARPQALFCYACGGEIVTAEGDEKISSAWFKEDIVSETQVADGPEEVAAEADVDSETDSDVVPAENTDLQAETVDDADQEKRGNVVRHSAKKKKLKSAADLRKRPKPVHSKRVEVVWKEKSGSPNLLFVVFGITIGVLAVIIFFASLYLK